MKAMATTKASQRFAGAASAGRRARGMSRRSMAVTGSMCVVLAAAAAMAAVLVVVGGASGAHGERTQQAPLRVRREASNGTNMTCPDGYEGDGATCIDIDECERSRKGIIVPPVCDPRTVCTNKDGTYVCGPCPSDFRGDGYSGCVRIPSIDVQDDNVVLHVDDGRDVVVGSIGATGNTDISLRSAISTAFAAKQSVAEASTGVQRLDTSTHVALSRAADISTAVDDVWSTLQRPSPHDETLSSNITDLQQVVSTGVSSLEGAVGQLSTHVSEKTSAQDDERSSLSTSVTHISNSVQVIEEDFEDAVLHLANVSDLAGVGHSLARALQEEIIGLTRQLNDTTTDVRSTNAHVLEVEESTNARISAAESTILSLSTRLEAAESELASVRSCAQQGKAYKDGGCVSVCPHIAECLQASCSQDSKGALRYTEGALEVCDGVQFTVVSADTTGLTPLDPAASCQELKELGYPTGVYYIGAGAVGTLHACDMSVTPARDLGGDGGERDHATTDCTALKEYFSLSDGQYWLRIGDDVAFVYCDVDSGEVEGDGSVAAFAAYSCKSIRTRYPNLGDGTFWITAEGNAPFQVTCNGQDVEVGLVGSDISSTGWVFSNSETNSWFKCQCANGLNWLKDKSGNWHYGVLVQDGPGNECQDYFTIDYTSAGNTLTAAQVLALAGLSKSSSNRNFEVYTTSCDDDSRGAPDGHWIGIEKTPGGGDYSIQDCTSDQGGGSQSSATSPTSDNEGCCDRKLKNEFDSFPFPLKGCASINTGGGVSLAFTTKTLRIHE